jgi:hypothetical protein
MGYKAQVFRLYLLWRRPGLRAEPPEFAQFFETDTDCLFGVSARRPHAGFDYLSTRPQSLSLSVHTGCLSYYS